jgi:DNA-binding NarL/FixJ family response regulator
VASILSLEKDVQIVAQCDEHDHAAVRVAVETLRASTAIISLPILHKHPYLLSPLKETSTGLIVVTSADRKPSIEVARQLRGTISRDISSEELVACVRHVSRGQHYVPNAADAAPVESDLVGICVRNRLTRRELQVVGFIARAYKNKQIADCLGTKEQVVKNYTRNLFVKCGVSNRLALALFTSTHPILAEAGERASTLLIKARSAHLLVKFPKSSSETTEAYSSAASA